LAILISVMIIAQYGRKAYSMGMRAFHTIVPMAPDLQRN
jgi:hypothetical protein